MTRRKVEQLDEVPWRPRSATKKPSQSILPQCDNDRAAATVDERHYCAETAASRVLRERRSKKKGRASTASAFRTPARCFCGGVCAASKVGRILFSCFFGNEDGGKHCTTVSMSTSFKPPARCHSLGERPSNAGRPQATGMATPS